MGKLPKAVWLSAAGLLFCLGAFIFGSQLPDQPFASGIRERPGPVAGQSSSSQSQTSAAQDLVGALNEKHPSWLPSACQRGASKPTAACYKASKAIVIRETAALVDAVYRVEDAISERRPNAFLASELGAARRKHRQETIPKAYFLDMKLSFWGFDYKSAADLEIRQWRLETCEMAASAMSNLYGTVTSQMYGTVDRIAADAGDYTLLITNCERAIGRRGRQSNVREVGRAFIEACRRMKARSGACVPISASDDRERRARATKNSDHAKLP